MEHFFPISAMVVLAALCPPTLAQGDVWVVDDDGFGDFDQIATAVAAAVDGDTIVVRKGIYSGFDITDEDLRVLGDPEGGVQVNGLVTIANVSANRVVVLSDLSLRGAPGPAVRLTSNPGHVRLQSCSLVGTFDSGCSGTPVSRALEVEACADLFLSHCTLRGSDGGVCFLFEEYGGADAASVVSSSVALYDCELVGGKSTDHDTSGGAQDGGAGCRVIDSFLFASNSRIAGGQGGDICCTDFCDVTLWGGTGGAGLLLGGGPSEVQLLASQIEGGPGGDDLTDCLFSGCFCTSPGNPGPAIHNPSGSTVDVLPGERREMVIPHWIVGTPAVDVTFIGEPGDEVFLPSDSQTGFAWEPTLQGVWQLANPVVPSTSLGVIPGGGTLTVPVTLPGLPAGQTTGTLFQQAYFVDTRGGEFLGTPDSTVLIDCVPVPSAYCVAAPNSVGAGTRMGYAGSIEFTANDLILTASAAPSQQLGLFFYGPESQQVVFGNGFLCVDDANLGFFRLNPPQLTSATGSASRPLDLTDPPEPDGQITAGSTWFFQFWYRDPDGGGAFFNMSDGLRVTFCP